MFRIALAQQAKMLARNHKTAFKFFSKRQSRSLVGACQVLWLRIVGGTSTLAADGAVCSKDEGEEPEAVRGECVIAER